MALQAVGNFSTCSSCLIGIVSMGLKVPPPCDSPVINVSSEVLFQAVGCDLVGKVGEAVAVSGTAIVPLQLQVSRN